MSNESCIRSYFPIILKEFATVDQKLNVLVKTLQSLEVDFQEWQYNIDELPFIASYLHKLYIIPSEHIRTTVLRICFQLELYSEKTICELYHFDLLIVVSLDQYFSNANSKSEEINVCFEYILLLLKTNKKLPFSIIRTLVSIYPDQNKTYKSLILSILGQFTLLSDNSNLFPEIGQLFIDSLIEGVNDNIFELISYGFENGIQFLSNGHLINQLLSPISQIEENQALCDKSCSIISRILATWPGLFVFGLEMNGIENLVRCCTHKGRYVIQIIKGLFVFNDKPDVITNAYCAFLIKILIDFDFLRVLNHFSKDPYIGSFYTSLMPYLTKYSYNNLPKVNKSILQTKTKFRIPAVFCQNNSFPVNYDLQSYQLPQDPTQYDWKIIQMKISICMPSNENDIRNSIPFYQCLLDYFTGPFINSTSFDEQIVADCFIDLIDFLIKTDWGAMLIQKSESIKKAFKYTIEQLLCDHSIGLKSPIWTFFESISKLMATQTGIKILTIFELLEDLRKLGSSCTNLHVVERITSMIRFYPDGGWAIPVFSEFINSTNPGVSSLSIRELKRKIENSNFQKDELFSMMLIPHINMLYNKEEYDKLKEPFGLLMELIYKYEICFKSIVSNQQMLLILSKCDHFIYSFVLSDPNSHKISPNIEDEILWWISEGNKEYLTVFDKAMEFAFLKKSNILKKFPSIISMGNGLTIAPPHLFSQLPKSKNGFDLISKYIPQIVNDIPNSSINNQRASFFALANFASIPGETQEIIEKENVAEIMIKTALNSNSYVLKGSLLYCLSLFQITDSFSKILIKYGFEMFFLGHQKLIVPTNYSIFLKKEVHHEEPVIPVPLKNELVPPEIAKGLIELLDPITSKVAKDFLFTLYREKAHKITTTDIALYAHQLMTNFSYSSDTRKFIFGMFKQTSLYPRSDLKCDTEISAIVKAKFFILHNKSFACKPGIMNIQLPKYSLSNLITHANEKYSLICKSVAEVYLSDDEFFKATNIDKKTFYSLNKNEQQKIRCGLLIAGPKNE